MDDLYAEDEGVSRGGFGPPHTYTKYLNGPGVDNKLRLTSETDGFITDDKYFLADHLGSTNGLTNVSGTVTEQTGYDSFGNPTAGLSTRYQFTGRERDDLTGLQYSRARWYDPNLGRFISEDPIGFRGGDINLYGYVWNVPLLFTDSFGRQADRGIEFLPPGSIGTDSYEKIRKAFDSMRNNCECKKAYERFGIHLDDLSHNGIVVGSSDTVANGNFQSGDLRLSDNERERATPHIGAARAFTVTTTEADPRPKIFMGPDAYSNAWTPLSDPNRNFRRAFAHELMHAGGMPGMPSWWPFTDDLSYLNGWWYKPYWSLLDKCSS